MGQAGRELFDRQPCPDVTGCLVKGDFDQSAASPTLRTSTRANRMAVRSRVPGCPPARCDRNHREPRSIGIRRCMLDKSIGSALWIMMSQTQATELFRVLSDPTRRGLFERLSREGDLTVSALTA